MTPEILEGLTGTLDCLKREALARMRGGARELTEEEALPPDMVDRASIEAERHFALLMRERDRKLLQGIQEALSRLDKGEYGLCGECGEEISLARLKARPAATLCVICQTALEQEEHVSPKTADAAFFQA